MKGLLAFESHLKYIITIVFYAVCTICVFQNKIFTSTLWLTFIKIFLLRMKDWLLIKKKLHSCMIGIYHKKSIFYTICIICLYRKKITTFVKLAFIRLCKIDIYLKLFEVYLFYVNKDHQNAQSEIIMVFSV